MSKKLTRDIVFFGEEYKAGIVMPNNIELPTYSFTLTKQPADYQLVEKNTPAGVYKVLEKVGETVEEVIETDDEVLPSKPSNAKSKNHKR